MNYYEISFTLNNPDLDSETLSDILAFELGNIGFESFTTDENGMTGYITVDNFDKNSLEEILNEFPIPQTVIQYKTNIVEDKNWNEEWEKHYFQPIHIEKECIIRASFHPDEQGFKYEIIIDPKMAFGTGNHATTFLMINEMLKTELKDKAVLDMGCGTAVLAILASKKEASRIVAIDIDEWAYDNALENCKLNNTENIKVIWGGAEKIKDTGLFDYIFANINRNILLQDIKNYVPALKKGGQLFMSGFYKEDIPIIEKECNNNGLKTVGFSEKDNWVAVGAQFQ
jgi:ribosomal protein L11 methyltransferase